jgi:argininosuccinate synthase
MNERAGPHGVGRVELIEDWLTGVKSREAYEAPGATALMTAHSALEDLVLTYETLQCKAEVARRYAELVYAGGWFSGLRDALDAFVEVTQRQVVGEIRLELYRGTARVVGRRSHLSLYDDALVRDARGCPARPGGFVLPRRRAVLCSPLARRRAPEERDPHESG